MALDHLSFLKKIFIFERGSASGGGAKRGRGGQRSRSRLCTDSSKPDAGLELTSHEIMIWAEVGRSTDWAGQAPHITSWFEDQEAMKWVNPYISCTCWNLFMLQQSNFISTFPLWVQTAGRYVLSSHYVKAKICPSYADFTNPCVVNHGSYFLAARVGGDKWEMVFWLGPMISQSLIMGGKQIIPVVCTTIRKLGQKDPFCQRPYRTSTWDMSFPRMLTLALVSVL